MSDNGLAISIVFTMGGMIFGWFWGGWSERRFQKELGDAKLEITMLRLRGVEDERNFLRTWIAERGK